MAESEGDPFNFVDGFMNKAWAVGSNGEAEPIRLEHPIGMATDHSVIWSCERPDEFEDALTEVATASWPVEEMVEELEIIAHDLSLARVLHPEHTIMYDGYKARMSELRSSLLGGQ